MAALIDGRRLVYIGGTSRKYWEWRLYEDYGETRLGLSYRLTVRWGRIGTAGQSQEEVFTDRRLAEWKAATKEKEKRAKGYAPDDKQITRGADVNREATRAVLGLDKPRRRAAAPTPKADSPPLVAVRRVRLRD